MFCFCASDSPPPLPCLSPPHTQTALKLSESSSMDISEQAFLELHQISRTPRGQMVHADPGRHLFDTSMFRLVWGPAVRGGGEREGQRGVTSSEGNCDVQ